MRVVNSYPALIVVVPLTLRFRHIFWFGRLLRKPPFLLKWITGSALNSFIPGECKYILIRAVTASSTKLFVQWDLMILSGEKPLSYYEEYLGVESNKSTKRRKWNAMLPNIYFLPIELLFNILGTIPSYISTLIKILINPLD